MKDVTVTWGGMTFGDKLEVPIYLNDTNTPQTNGSRAILQTVQLAEHPDALQLLVGLLFNHTSELVVLQLPETSVDVYYNGVRAGNGTVAPNRMEPGEKATQTYFGSIYANIVY